MSDDLTFESARDRLEAIIDRVKDRNTDLDEAIALLEEGVRVANVCTEKLAEEATGRITGDEQGAQPEEEVISEANA